MHFCGENSLVEPSGSQEPGRRSITQTASTTPMAGSPGMPRTPFGWRGQEAAGVLHEGVSLCWASRAQGPGNVGQKQSRAVRACVSSEATGSLLNLERWSLGEADWLG